MNATKRILLTGASGFIGRYFINTQQHSYSIVGIDKFVLKQFSHTACYQADICDYKSIKSICDKHLFDVIIHAAAEKSLINCEENKESAYKINYAATINLLEIARKMEAKFIFVSSDQVFGGKKGLYNENDETNPINYYGTLKIMAEQEIVKQSQTAICRTAMVFGNTEKLDKALFDSIKNEETLKIQSYVVNYVKWALTQKRHIMMPDDEYINPTYIGLLTRQLIRVIDTNAEGILHCAGKERISRYSFCKKIADYYNMNSDYIIPVKHSDILRPVDVSLDVSATEQVLAMRFNNIDEMLDEMGCTNV